MLRATYKIVVDSCTHFESLLIGEMQHPSWVLLPPMLKSMHPNFSVMLLAILVHMLLGVIPNTIFIQPVIFGNAVVEIQGKDGLVQQLNLVEFVASMVAWKRTIIGKPSQLRGIHNVPNCNGVHLGGVTGPSVHNSGGKLTELTH